MLVRIAWWRQEYRATYREMHTALASQVRISESHVGYVYQQVSLPLLACHERQHRDHLAQIAQAQGGLIIALDGLAPQGGEPQIWFIRELTSGFTLRSGWLSQQDQPTFEAFLKPLTHLEWPMLAVLSATHTGLVPAVATVFPDSRSQCCQAHSLRNLAEPLAEADAAFTQTLSLCLAILLITIYGLGILFSLKTHREFFGAAEEHGEEGHGTWPLGLALGTLGGVTVLVALVSEVFVASVEEAARAMGMTDAFVGFVVVALVGGAAEMAAALSKNFANS